MTFFPTKRDRERYIDSESERARGEFLFGITAEEFIPPTIPQGAKVLDIGSGDSRVTQKLISMTGAENVSVVEPNIKTNSESTHLNLRDLLPPQVTIYNATLQETLINHPNIKQQFDVACVFKYNIRFSEKEDFIKALSQTIKPNGTVYITSVEWDRVAPVLGKINPPYIMNVLQAHFREVELNIIVDSYGFKRYALITCRDPISSE